MRSIGHRMHHLDLHFGDALQLRAGGIHDLLRPSERVRSTTIEQQRESWKVRALIAEAQLLEATAKTTNNDRCQNIRDVRYASTVAGVEPSSTSNVFAMRFPETPAEQLPLESYAGACVSWS